mgnify:FL=1
MMHYELQQDHNTGNWWIMQVEPNGHRKVVMTLGPVDHRTANQHLKAYMEKLNG